MKIAIKKTLKITFILLFSILLSAIALANSAPALNSVVGGAKEKEPFESSLVGYWDMDDWNATYIMDRTGNNNDGLIVGVNRSNGKLGYGMVFDGTDDYVSVPDSNLWPLGTNPFTISFWINFKDLNANSDIMGQSDGGGIEDKWFIGYNFGGTNVMAFDVAVSGGSETTTLFDWTASVNKWYHLAIIRSGNSLYFYVNGVQTDAAQAFSLSIPDSSSTLKIGADGELWNYVNGLIDEVKIYNKALTADEVAKQYSQGLGTGNITTQNPLAVSVNSSTDADNDILYTAVDWYKDGIKNATTGKPDDNGTVLFMPFDSRNTTGITEDYSVMNNDGNIIGAVFTNDSAVGLGAYSFDGVNDYVNISHDSSLNITGAITIEMWVKSDVSSGSLVKLDRMVEKTNSYAFDFNHDAWGKANFGFSHDGSNWVNLQYLTTLPANTWMHLAATYDRQNIRVYLNGVQDNILAETRAIATSNNNVYIGTYGATPTGTYNFNGSIDEVHIYNRSLTASEIQQHYEASKLKGLTLNHSETKKNEWWNATITLYDNATAASTAINFSFSTIENTPPDLESMVAGAKEKEPFSNNLVGYWDMDDWNATYILDKTSNNNDGLIVSANRSNGKLGYGMLFDGTDDYIDAGDAGTIKAIEFWINPRSSNEYVMDFDGGVNYLGYNGFPAGFEDYDVYVDGVLASGSQEVTNGDSDSLTGWTVNEGSGPGTTSIVSENIRQAMGGTSSDMQAYQTLSLTNGATYRYSFAGVSENVDGANEATFQIGTSQLFGAGTVHKSVQWGTTGADTYSGTFTAGATNILSLINRGAASRIIQWDNITIKRVINPITANTWHHVAVISTKDIDASAVNIGKIGSNYFNGSIDEVKIWNKALTADEIAKHYSQGMGIGNITTQNPLAVSVNASSDADGDDYYAAVDWYKDGILNATTGHPNHNNSVLFMPFDQRNTTGITEDYSVMNNDGAINGSKFTNDSAMGFGAMEFDGKDDYVNAGNDDSLNPSLLTLEAWFKPNKVSTLQTIIGRNDIAANAKYGYFITLADTGTGNIEFGGGNSAGTAFELSYAAGLSVGNWYYVAGIYDGSRAHLYLNGKEVGTPVSVNSLYVNSFTTYIGRYRPGGASEFYFNGTIDELRIYNRSLNASEIEQHYWAGIRKGLTLNQSQTAINERWNATITLYDTDTAASTPKNFTFGGDSRTGGITGCGYLSAEGTWDIDGADECVLYDNYDLGGNNIVMDGAGTFKFNGYNITNYGTIVMRGTSSTERLTVTCDTGCFKN